MVRESIQQLMTCALMSTLVPWRVSSERSWEDSVSWTGGCMQELSTLLLTGVNVTGNICSKASLEEKQVLKSQVCFDQNRTNCQYCLKKPSFQSYNTLMDTSSITISRYWLLHYNATISWRKNWRIASQKVNQKFRCLVLTSHAATSLKAVLHCDFVNTFGQKLCTLYAHFTQSYSALDTLPNHYY